MGIVSDMIIASLKGKTYEASESTRDRSVREMKLGPHHINHRFPIRGGIGIGEITQLAISARNPLFEALAARKRKRT
jgi:hypothetical protein